MIEALEFDRLYELVEYWNSEMGDETERPRITNLGDGYTAQYAWVRELDYRDVIHLFRDGEEVARYQKGMVHGAITAIDLQAARDIREANGVSLEWPELRLLSTEEYPEVPPCEVLVVKVRMGNNTQDGWSCHPFRVEDPEQRHGYWSHAQYQNGFTGWGPIAPMRS